jgi:release factor glutamine methyltransferase
VSDQSKDQSATWTVGTIVRWATDDFRARGIESPRLDAEVLVAHVLGLTRTQLIIQSERQLDKGELAELRALIKRRRNREPVAYLRGFREFYGRPFNVNAAVLIPRPDTETLIEVALRVSAHSSLCGRALELCTGSGAVAISFERERPTWRVYATDISEPALAVARTNAHKLGASRVAFRNCDLFAGVEAFGVAAFDLILANPPYIPSAEIETLDEDVRKFEPRLALDGGADGLDYYRRIAVAAPRFLRAGGHLALEVGAGEAPDVANLLQRAGFVQLQIDRDFARIERVVCGTWPGK